MARGRDPRGPVGRRGGAAPALFLAALLGVLGPARLGALESATPVSSRERAVGRLDELSTKPLYRFTMRGRRDPFLPNFVLTLHRPRGVDIDGLTFSGVLSVGGGSVALFSDSTGAAYVLRSGRLYDPEDRPVPDVTGSIDGGAGGYAATLEQDGERLGFAYRRPSQRLDPSGQP